MKITFTPKLIDPALNRVMVGYSGADVWINLRPGIDYYQPFIEDQKVYVVWDSGDTTDDQIIEFSPGRTLPGDCYFVDGIGSHEKLQPGKTMPDMVTGSIGQLRNSIGTTHGYIRIGDDGVITGTQDNYSVQSDDSEKFDSKATKTANITTRKTLGGLGNDNAIMSYIPQTLATPIASISGNIDFIIKIAGYIRTGIQVGLDLVTLGVILDSEDGLPPGEDHWSSQLQAFAGNDITRKSTATVVEPPPGPRSETVGPRG